MRRRSFITVLVLALVASAAGLWPSATFACDIRDPGCYIQDFTHKQLYDLNLSIWQLNQAGLILARWFEELRLWLIETVMVNVFTALTRPVIQFFTLALVVAWMLFVISFLVQSFVDFRWVDIRRALRPILLAWLVYQFGGNVVLWTENVRVLGGSLIQQTALEVMATFQAPSISSASNGDMADASRSIYASDTSCGTSKRSIEAMYLGDYAARYLWATGDDVHCADLFSPAGEFRGRYFEQMDISDQSNSDKRQQAVRLAAQGGLRQITGLFLTLGAIVEQIVHLIFAMALALVWFGLLLSLVFALFLPTEALLISQITALLTVLRGSWLASLLIGLGLAVLRLVAGSGNGFLMLFCGLVLIAVCIWQGKQALVMVGTAMSSVNSVVGSAPSAVGGMMKGWATTAAVVAGVAATGGGLGAALGQVGSTMLRRAGRHLGDNPVSQAAGRVLSNRLADKLDARLEDGRLERDAELSTQEAAWYERKLYDGVGAPEIDADASRQRARSQERARQQLAQLKGRQAERARKAGNFHKADRLRREARRLGGDERATGGAANMPDGDELDLDRAAERLHEAGDDEEMQRRVLADVAAQSHRRAQRNAMRSRVRQVRQPAGHTASGKPQALDSAANRAALPNQGTPTPPSTDDEPSGLPPLTAGKQRLAVTKTIGGITVNGRAVTQIVPREDGSKAELHLADGSIVTLTAEEYRDMLRFGRVVKTGRVFLVRGDVTPSTEAAGPAADRSGQGVPAAARARSLPLRRLPQVTNAGAGGAENGATAPHRAHAPSAVTTTLPAQPSAKGAPSGTSGQPLRGRSAEVGRRRKRVGAQGGVGNGATSVNGAGGRPLRAGEAAPSAAAGASNVAPVSPLPAAPARAIEQPDGSPPASTSVPGAAQGAAANVPAASAPAGVPAASRSASTPADQPQPPVGTAATPSVAAPAPVPASAPAQATPAVVTPVVEAGPRPATSAPASTPAPAPAPRATNGLPLATRAGTAAPLPAQAGVAPRAEAREPAVQPARAASGPALPKVPEVQRRGEGGSSRPAPAAAVPVDVAAPTGAAASRQPWKRGKRGES